MSVGVTGRNVAANLAGGIWNALLSMLVVPIYLRFLGAEAFGLVGVLAALQAVFGLLDLGLGATLNREMARLSATASDGTRERDLLKTFEAVYWSLAALVGSAVLLLARAIAHRWVHAQHLSGAEITRAITYMGVIVALQLPFALYQAGLLGRQRQVVSNAINVSVMTVRSVGAVLLIWLVAPSVDLFFGWQAVMMLIQVGVTAAVLRFDLPRVVRRARVRPEMIRDLWRFSSALGLNAILGMMLTQTDKMLLSTMLPLSQFGYYTLAGSVAAVLWYVINPVTTAFYPRFTEILHADHEQQAVQTYHRGCQMMAALLLPVAATVAAFSHELIFLWTRDAAVAEATALVAAILICGTALNGLSSLPVMLGVAAGFPMIITFTNALAVCVIFPAIFLATRHYGALGAAAVWVLLNAMYIVVVVPLVHRRVLKGERTHWYANDFAKPLLVAGACAAVARLLLPGRLNAGGTLAYVAVSGALVAFMTAMALPHIRSLARQLLSSSFATVFGSQPN